MAEESRLQSRIHKYLKTKGWFINKVILCSVNGWPDTIAIKDGRLIMIEHKAKNKKLKPLQVYVHEQLMHHGMEVYTVDCWDEFKKIRI